jgi:uncharacterized protein involved in exopolysaccharide biosynthesis
VQDIDTQIAQLEQGLSAGRASGEGARRSGPNPIWQTLTSTRNDLRAEVAALQQTQLKYAQQVQDVNDRLLRLASLEPQFNELSRDRDVLSTNVRDFTVKEQQDEAQRQMSAAGSDNIRIVQRAVAPSTGKSLKKPVLVLAILFARSRPSASAWCGCSCAPACRLRPRPRARWACRFWPPRASSGELWRRLSR